MWVIEPCNRVGTVENQRSEGLQNWIHRTTLRLDVKVRLGGCRELRFSVDGRRIESGVEISEMKSKFTIVEVDLVPKVNVDSSSAPRSSLLRRKQV
ncbi:hypothetical protein AVEN_131961-1 [Araneus ventricosus]|uniref:Uncharacterized protein n=1 Tax=Araneus ventricosus TaxID=182803 RepID=A0A4Y2B2L0_ARAVE|nr:hypothetical protein AVEN_131961-1 [Araneus ventricosus]